MNQFDFTTYNKLMDNAGAGLKLHLAVQLLRSIAGTFEHFNNPLEDDVRNCLVDLKEVQVKAKAEAAARAEKTGKLMASDGKSE